MMGIYTRVLAQKSQFVKFVNFEKTKNKMKKKLPQKVVIVCSGPYLVKILNYFSHWFKIAVIPSRKPSRYLLKMIPTLLSAP
jgi:hypothetical protein